MIDLEVLRIGAKARAYEFAEKVRPIYKLLNWEWARSKEEGGSGIPSVEEIHDKIKKLIDDLNINNDYLSCGGIAVRKEYDEGELTGLSILMEVEDTVWLGDLK